VNIFEDGENTLKFDYVEDFAFNLEMFGEVPTEVLKFAKLFKEKIHK
jgi:hypothetical protein